MIAETHGRVGAHGAECTGGRPNAGDAARAGR
jgi:hypothetical protein